MTSLTRRTILNAAAGTTALGFTAALSAPTPAHAAAGPSDDNGSQDFSPTWEEDFSGTELDPTVWEHELGNIRGNEQQHYSSGPENVRVDNGQLVIAVTDRPAEDQYRNTERHGDRARLVKYNSGSVRTHAARDFLYGKLEVRARMPKGKGAFPAIWTLGHDFPIDGRIADEQGYGWPSTGEIDIAEMIGAPTPARAAEGEMAKPGTSNRTVHGTPHFWHWNGDGDGDGTYLPYPLGGSTRHGADLGDDFHVYGVNRTPRKIEWLFDGIVYRTLLFEPKDIADRKRRESARAGLDRPAYLQINLATGGNWAGDAGDHLAEDGTELRVEWVRFSQTEQQSQQDAQRRSQMPVLKGVKDLTMRQGETADLIADVTCDKADYAVELSVNDSPMFVNTGAPGGRNEVTRRVSSADDSASIAALTAGTYAIYYTAIPRDADLTGGQRPSAHTARRKAMLTVVAQDGS